MLNQFYSLIQTQSTGENTWTVRLQLNPEHPIYEGHFPGQPIVPGVCMLQFIKESAGNICQQTLQYIRIASCKFLSPIDPMTTPMLDIALELKECPDHTFQLQAEGKAGADCFIKLKAQLIAKQLGSEQLDSEQLGSEQLGSEQLGSEQLGSEQMIS